MRLNYEDLELRAGIKEPVNHLSKRIIELIHQIIDAGDKTLNIIDER